jgi:hypothetical protein
VVVLEARDKIRIVEISVKFEIKYLQMARLMAGRAIIVTSKILL